MQTVGLSIITVAMFSRISQQHLERYKITNILTTYTVAEYFRHFYYILNLWDLAFPGFTYICRVLLLSSREFIKFC
jgi:hypothetical protein